METDMQPKFSWVAVVGILAIIFLVAQLI